MHTLHQSPSTSRFTSIADLARRVAGAPLGSRKGIPCVYAGVESDEDGHKCLVAKTLDPSMDAKLVLTETAPEMVRKNYEYFTQRLKAIGLAVVDTENLLQLA